jgi:hypothetical protein
VFAWEPAPKDGDHVFEGPEGSKVFVDRKSYRFIDGTTLDYDTSLVSKTLRSTTRTPRALRVGRQSARMSTSLRPEQLANREYKCGFVTDVEARRSKGLSGRHQLISRSRSRNGNKLAAEPTSCS